MQLVENNITAFNQVQPHSSVSDRYKFISTKKYLEPFLERGFEVVELRQRSEFGSHLTTLQHKEHRLFNGDIPRLTLLNSHDRSKAFTVGFGIFRLVCENGLMIGEDFESFKFRHVGNIEEKIEESYTRIFAKFEELDTTIKKLSSTDYTDIDLLEFKMALHRIAEHRLNNPNSKAILKSLVRVHRRDDLGTDLYTLMNRVQENVIREGFQYSAFSEKRNRFSNLITKPILEDSITAVLSNNQKITNEFLKLVA